MQLPAALGACVVANEASLRLMLLLLLLRLALLQILFFILRLNYCLLQLWFFSFGGKFLVLSGLFTRLDAGKVGD